MRHLPNIITALRMLLTVPLAWAIREAQYDLALVIALAAGASDAADGYIAKRYGWQSWLGGVLDPMADKLLLVACFVSFALAGVQPLWLAGLVLGRDLLIVAGAVAYHNFIGPLDAKPTLLSKFTTCAQIALVLATLVHLSNLGELPHPINFTLQWLVVAATIGSGIDYVVRWSIKAWRERSKETRA